MITENLSVIRQNIANAAAKSGRTTEDVTLVCVTKEATLGEVEEAVACGVTDIGENRVQDAVARHSALRWTMDEGRGTIRWHLIGHLQTNKAKKAVEIFDLIHSVDTFHLAQAISREAARVNKNQDILIQVNISGEASKFGVKPEETAGLFEQITSLDNIRVLGLMTIAPLVDNPEKARPCFRRLRELLNEINASLRAERSEAKQSLSGDCFGTSCLAMTMSQLSMGMSQDYQVAIEEGATMVRIGSAIFK